MKIETEIDGKIATKFTIGLSQLEVGSLIEQSDDALGALETIRVALGRGQPDGDGSDNTAVLIPVYKYRLHTSLGRIEHQDDHWQLGETIAKSRGAEALKAAPIESALELSIWTRMILAPTRAQVQVAATLFLLRTFVLDLLKANCLGCQAGQVVSDVEDEEVDPADVEHTCGWPSAPQELRSLVDEMVFDENDWDLFVDKAVCLMGGKLTPSPSTSFGDITKSARESLLGGHELEAPYECLFAKINAMEELGDNMDIGSDEELDLFDL